jgi:hypothetical protein
VERQPEILLAAAQGRLPVGGARGGVPREVLQGAHGDDIGPFGDGIGPFEQHGARDRPVGKRSEQQLEVLGDDLSPPVSRRPYRRVDAEHAEQSDEVGTA